MLSRSATHSSTKSNLEQRIALFNLLVSFVLLLVALLYLPKAQPELPLFYTLDETTKILVNKWYLLLLPVMIFGFSLINLVIILKIKTQLDELMTRLYAFACLAIVLVLSLAFLRIIYVTY